MVDKVKNTAVVVIGMISLIPLGTAILTACKEVPKQGTTTNDYDYGDFTVKYVGGDTTIIIDKKTSCQYLRIGYGLTKRYDPKGVITPDCADSQRSQQ